MIETTKLTAAVIPGNAGAIDISSSGDTNKSLQLIDLEGVNFENALFSQLVESAEGEPVQLPRNLLTDKPLLPDGKGLPLLPLTTQPGDADLGRLADVNTELDDGDEPVTFLPLALSQQLQPGRLLQKNLVTTMTEPGIKKQIAAPKAGLPTPDKAQTDHLLPGANDGPAIKTDLAAAKFELNLPATQIAERSADSTGIVNTGINARLTGAESANPATNMLRLAIDAPLHQGKWADNLAGRVAWMAMNSQQSAQISLNPPELGPIEVRINLHNDQANVNFYAHNNTVRDAIEDAFPRLRDMLNANGLNLGQSSVSDQSLSGRQGHAEASWQEPSRHAAAAESDSIQTRPHQLVNLKLGLIDQFV